MNDNTLDPNSNLNLELNSIIQLNQFSNYLCNIRVSHIQVSNDNEFGDARNHIVDTKVIDFCVFHMQQNIDELIQYFLALFNIVKPTGYFHLFLNDRLSNGILSLNIDFMTSLISSNQQEILHFDLNEFPQFFVNKHILAETVPNINPNDLNLISFNKIVLYERLKQIGIDNYLEHNEFNIFLIEYTGNQLQPHSHLQHFYPNVNYLIEKQTSLITTKSRVFIEKQQKQLEELNEYYLTRSNLYHQMITHLNQSNEYEFPMNIYFHEIHWQLSTGDNPLGDVFYDLNSFYNFFELRPDVPISNLMDATSGKKNVDLLNSKVKIYKDFINTKFYRELERWKQTYKKDLGFLHQMNKVFSCRGFINIDPDDEKILVDTEHLMNTDKSIYQHGIEYFFIFQSDGNITVRFHIPFNTEVESEKITIRRFYLWLEKFKQNIIQPYYDYMKTKIEPSNGLELFNTIYRQNNSLFYILQELLHWKQSIQLKFEEISYMNLFFDITSSQKHEFNPIIGKTSFIYWLKANEYFVRKVDENNSVDTGIIFHMKYKNISNYENMEMIFDVMSAYVYKYQLIGKEEEIVRNELLKMLKENYQNRTEQEMEQFVNDWIYKYFKNKSRYTKSFSGVDILISKVSNDYRIYLNGFRNFDDYRHVIFYVYTFFKFYFYHDKIPFVKDIIEYEKRKLVTQGGDIEQPIEENIPKHLFSVEEQDKLDFKRLFHLTINKSRKGGNKITKYTPKLNINDNENENIIQSIDNIPNNENVTGGSGVNRIVSLSRKLQIENDEPDVIESLPSNNESSFASETNEFESVASKEPEFNGDLVPEQDIEISRHDAIKPIEQRSVSERSTLKSKSSGTSRTLIARYEQEPHTHQHEDLLVAQEQSYRGYRISLLMKLDPEVFKNTGKKAYSRFCQVSSGRVPIVIKDDANFKQMLKNTENNYLLQLKKDKIKPDEVNSRMKAVLRGDERLMVTKKNKLIDGYSLKYRGKHYICPEAWCIHCQMPLLLKDLNVRIKHPITNEEITLEQYFELKLNEKKKYPDFQIISGNCPKCNGDIILNEDSKDKRTENQKVLIAKNAVGRQGYPGFISKKSHPNELCMVCCFNNPLNKINKDGGKYFYKDFMTYEGYEGEKLAQDKEHNSYVMPSHSVKTIKKKSSSTEDIQISLKPCHIHRFGLLPETLNNYLNSHPILQEYTHITGLPFQKKSEQYYQFLRKGIPWSAGMLNNLMDLMYYYLFDFEQLNVSDGEVTRKILSKDEKIQRIITHLQNIPNFNQYFEFIENGLLKFYFKEPENLFRYLKTNPIWNEEFILPLLSIPTLEYHRDDALVSHPVFVIFYFDSHAIKQSDIENPKMTKSEKYLDQYSFQNNLKVLVSHRDFTDKHHIYFIFKRKIQDDISAFEEQSWTNGGWNYEPIVFLSKNENENPKTMKLFQYIKLDSKNNINENNEESKSINIIQLLNSNINEFVSMIVANKDFDTYNEFKNSYLKPKELNSIGFSMSSVWVDLLFRHSAILCSYNDRQLWIPIYPKIYTFLEELVQLKFIDTQQRSVIFNYLQSPSDTINILNDWYTNLFREHQEEFLLIPYKYVLRKINDKFYITGVITTNKYCSKFTTIPTIPTEFNESEYKSSNEIEKNVFIRKFLQKVLRKVQKVPNKVKESLKNIIDKLKKIIDNNRNILQQETNPINQILIEKYDEFYNEIINDILEEIYLLDENEIVEKLNEIIELQNNIILDYYSNLDIDSDDLIGYSVYSEKMYELESNDIMINEGVNGYLYDLGNVLSENGNRQLIDERIKTSYRDMNDKYNWKWIQYLFATFIRKMSKEDINELANIFDKKILSEDEKQTFKEIYRDFCLKYIKIIKDISLENISEIEYNLYRRYMEGKNMKRIIIPKNSNLIVKFYKYFTENEFFRHPFFNSNWQWDMPTIKERITEYEFIYAEWNVKILEALSVFKLAII